MIARKRVSTNYTEGPGDCRKSRSGEHWRTSSNFTQFLVSDHDLCSLTSRTLGNSVHEREGQSVKSGSSRLKSNRDPDGRSGDECRGGLEVQ